MSDNRIKIRGLGSIVLKGDNPEAQKEYLITIRAEMEKIEKDIQDPANPIYTFIFRYLTTEKVEAGGKKIEVEKGRTMSQKLRFVLMDLARVQGIDPDEYYKSEMARLIQNYNDKLN